MARDCVVIVDVDEAAPGWRGDETRLSDDEGHWDSRTDQGRCHELPR